MYASRSCGTDRLLDEVDFEAHFTTIIALLVGSPFNSYEGFTMLTHPGLRKNKLETLEISKPTLKHTPV